VISFQGVSETDTALRIYSECAKSFWRCKVMFGDVLVHLGCIQNHRSPCGMSYECIQVDSELILHQDPISGNSRHLAIGRGPGCITHCLEVGRGPCCSIHLLATGSSHCVNFGSGPGRDLEISSGPRDTVSSTHCLDVGRGPGSNICSTYSLATGSGHCFDFRSGPGLNNGSSQSFNVSSG
jgi:hypothetical protein